VAKVVGLEKPVAATLRNPSRASLQDYVAFSSAEPRSLIVPKMAPQRSLAEATAACLHVLCRDGSAGQPQTWARNLL